MPSNPEEIVDRTVVRESIGRGVWIRTAASSVEVHNRAILGISQRVGCGLVAYCARFCTPRSAKSLILLECKLNGIQEVVSSILIGSTFLFRYLAFFRNDVFSHGCG